MLLLLPFPRLGWVDKNRTSEQNKKTRWNLSPSPRWRGASCRTKLSLSCTFPPLAVPSLDVPPLALPSRSTIFAGPLLSRAGSARSRPPNPTQNVPPAQNVPPGPDRQHLNFLCPMEREGSYRPFPSDVPGGYKSPGRIVVHIQWLSSAAGCRLAPFGLCVCVCVCVFIKFHITAQSGPVILVILCHSH